MTDLTFDSFISQGELPQTGKDAAVSPARKTLPHGSQGYRAGYHLKEKAKLKHRINDFSLTCDIFEHLTLLFFV